jgi:hypothetical protein
MKLNAISGNGTRLKDFIDIAYLSSSIPLAEMIDAFSEKYETRNPAMLVKALDYHQDIDFEEPIQMLSRDYNWKTIEKRLGEMTRYPLQLFADLAKEEKMKDLSKSQVKQKDIGDNLDQGKGIRM